MARSCRRWEKLGVISPGWRNLFENVMTVQFQHRMIAYALWLLALLHALHGQRIGGGRPGKAGCCSRS